MALGSTKKYILSPALVFALLAVFFAPSPAVAASNADRGRTSGFPSPVSVGGNWQDREDARSSASFISLKGPQLRRTGFAPGAAGGAGDAPGGAGARGSRGSAFYEAGLSAAQRALFSDITQFVRDKMIAVLHAQDGMR